MDIGLGKFLKIGHGLVQSIREARKKKGNIQAWKLYGFEAKFN